MEAVSSKPKRKLTVLKILLGSFGNDLSILDVGISDIELVRYPNGS
jgi:hypothetical protein